MSESPCPETIQRVQSGLLFKCAEQISKILQGKFDSSQCEVLRQSEDPEAVGIWK